MALFDQIAFLDADHGPESEQAIHEAQENAWLSKCCSGHLFLSEAYGICSYYTRLLASHECTQFANEWITNPHVQQFMGRGAIPPSIFEVGQQHEWSAVRQLDLLQHDLLCWCLVTFKFQGSPFCVPAGKILW